MKVRLTKSGRADRRITLPPEPIAPVEPYPIVGTLLRIAADRGISTSALARMAGIRSSVIDRIADGERDHLRSDTIGRLMTALQLEVK